MPTFPALALVQGGASLDGRGWAVLGLVTLALILFLWNRFRADVVAALIMALLMVSGLVTPEQGVSGFANEATITVAMMLVLTSALLRTGAVDVLAAWLTRLAGDSEFRLLAVIVVLVMPVSAVINNTAAVAVLLPAVLGIARQRGLSPSRLLMPLSFAAQLGGTLTLVGTSTNLLVAGLAHDLGIERIGIFDMTAPAALVALVGGVYLLTLGRWLTPRRRAAESLLESYELHDYLATIRLRDGSPLIGRSLGDLRFSERRGLDVVRIEGEERVDHVPDGASVLRRGDRLLVEGKVGQIAAIGEEDGLEIAGVDSELLLDTDEDEDSDAVRLAEIMVTPRSPLRGRTLRGLRFRSRFGMSVLGVRRHAQPLREDIAAIRFHAGDVLLVRGRAAALAELHERGELALIGAIDPPVRRRSKRWTAVAIVAAVVLLPALGLTTILVSATAGAVVALLAGCLTPDEAYDDVDWMVIVLIGALIPLGIAMRETGAAAFLASHLLGALGPLGPHALLAGFLLLTTALTSIVSNAAAAVVLTPIAIAMAATLGVSPMPFVIGVMIAASNAFLTPIGYQTNTFIYGPGGYRFRDFVVVGGPLSLLILASASAVIPLFFPFAG